MINTGAYYNTATIIEVKRFTVQAPGVKMIRLVQHCMQCSNESTLPSPQLYIIMTKTYLCGENIKGQHASQSRHYSPPLSVVSVVSIYSFLII